jgi:hypothetical protein
VDGACDIIIDRGYVEIKLKTDRSMRRAKSVIATLILPFSLY